MQQQVTEAAVGERESPQQEGVSVDNRSEQEEEDDWEIGKWGTICKRQEEELIVKYISSQPL